MPGFTTDLFHSLPDDVSHDTVLDVGPLTLDKEEWHSFRVYNDTNYDDEVVLFIHGKNADWFKFSKWKYSTATSTITARMTADSCSDTIWLSCLVPLDADLSQPWEAYITTTDIDSVSPMTDDSNSQIATYGTLNLSFNPVETYKTDEDPYPNRTGIETDNFLELFATSREATQISIERYEPLPVPTEPNTCNLVDIDTASWVDCNNDRVGYKKTSEIRTKVFLGDRLPSQITNQLRLQTNYSWEDSIRIILPPDGYLPRTWALFNEGCQDERGRTTEVSTYKRTVYVFYYQGQKYYIDHVVPTFTFSSELCFFQAQAFSILEPASSNEYQELPWNKLYRYQSHRPIDYVQSFNPTPDIFPEESGVS